MAINWTTAAAAKAIKEGNKEAIVDIGRRFPLFLAAVAANDIDTILAAIPEHITARKIEAALKDGVQESDVEDTDSDVEDEKPAKKEKAEKKPAKKAKKEEDTDTDTDEDDDPVELYKQCKKAGLKVKPKQSADYYKKQLATLEEQDDDDDDWGDEEDEAPKKKPAKKEEKKPAKKAKKEEVESDDDDDDDDWDI